MMNIYKKALMMSVATIALTMSGLLLARCASCAEKMAIKQSIKEAMAAAVAASKPSGKKDQEIDTLEDVKASEEAQPCCTSCANGGPCDSACDSKRCGCPDNKSMRPDAWVAAENGDMSNCCAQVGKMECMLDALLKIDEKINRRLKEQGRDAEKCCKHVRHELDEIEDLILSQTDEAAVCCSTTEALILSQTDAAATCCVSMNSRLDVLEFQMSINDLQIMAALNRIIGCTCT